MRQILTLSVTLFLYLGVYAQPSLQRLEKKLEKESRINGADRYQLNITGKSRAMLRFGKAYKLAKEQGRQWLTQALDFRPGKDALQPKGRPVIQKGGIEVEQLQQYFDGIPVEHGSAKLLIAGGNLTAIQLELYTIPDRFSTQPARSSQEALTIAAAHMGARRYNWQESNGANSEARQPKGDLVIVEDFYKNSGTLHLAYRFDITALDPVGRWMVYVDAQSGAILLVNPLIKHLGNTGETNLKAGNVEDNKEKGSMPPPNASGNAQTRYSGTRTIIGNDESADLAKPFRLRQLRNGHQITTLNYERRTYSSTNNALAIDFSDNDNNWTEAEHGFNYDNAALDVQLAMQYVSDYWKSVHNRNSWDDQGGEMKSYVHVRTSATQGYNNAFWNGSAMFYGDGTYYSTDGLGTVADPNGFKPLTSLDVSAHELGHAVCQATADLVYTRESGALNEGFSDIWAACAEHFSGLPKNIWQIGEELLASGRGIRNMENPKANNFPDTYGGSGWCFTSLAGCPVPNSSSNDYCGVHINSSVLNKWFYLITQGGSGTNDLRNSYGVSGLGFARSEQIAYLTELMLTPTSDFAAAREASIAAATALFGDCTNEVMQVTNAWFAVGVGETANCSPTIEFSRTTTAVAEGIGFAGNCTSDMHIPVRLKIGAKPSASAVVNFSFAGTATYGVDYYAAQSSLNISEGGYVFLNLYLKNDATPEANETIVISFSVNPGSGNATASLNNQVHTITITNDDGAPAYIRSAAVPNTTLVSENFDNFPSGTAFPVGWESNLAFGGGSSVNRWAIGSSGGAGISGKAAYISTTAGTTQDYNYNITSATDRLLRLPALNTTGLKDIRISFRYKVEGEHYPTNSSYSSLWDYARIVYSTNGTSFTTLTNPATGEPYALYGNGADVGYFSAVLPAVMENKTTVYIGLRWTNDNADGSGIPILVDEVVVTGTNTGVSIETRTGFTSSVSVLSGSGHSYLTADGGRNLLARINNASEYIPCISGKLLQSGTGAVPFQLGGRTYLRSAKVVSLSPATPNATATYQASFYFTNEELSSWPAADIASLKLLKVKEGVDLSGSIRKEDVELVTPTIENQSANGYYLFAGSFTGFSQFMLVEAATVLPVRLLHFDAKPEGPVIRLSWQTADEQGNKGFRVERSTDGQTFREIGWVAASGALSGNYSFTDKTAQQGLIYTYRLRQEDLDGRFAYSSMRKVQLATAHAVLIAPNPARSFTEIVLPQGQERVQVALIDGNGKELMIWPRLQPGMRHRLTLKGVAAGIYLLEVRTGGSRQVYKLVVH